MHSLVAIVGFLVCVEVASGVLQGYYTPIFSDIADHLDIAGRRRQLVRGPQLIVSALVVVPLARLGDMVGHKRILLLSTAVTALGSWVLALAPSFGVFLVGAAPQGAYVVWLPLEVAIIYRRTADPPPEPAHPPRRGRARRRPRARSSSARSPAARWRPRPR